LTALQLDGFKLAAEIRDFAMSLGEVDGPPPPAEDKYRTAVWQHLQVWMGSYPPEDQEIRMKTIHGFETRKFRDQVEGYMHRVGEKGYPIMNATGFTDSIMDRRSLFRLASD